MEKDVGSFIEQHPVPEPIDVGNIYTYGISMGFANLPDNDTSSTTGLDQQKMENIGEDITPTETSSNKADEITKVQALVQFSSGFIFVTLIFIINSIIWNAPTHQTADTAIFDFFILSIISIVVLVIFGFTSGRKWLAIGALTPIISFVAFVIWILTAILW